MSVSALSLFDIAGRAMSAQLVRLNTTASNLANAGSVSATADGAFRSLKPVFETVYDAADRATVRVTSVVSAGPPPAMRSDPSNPLADQNGHVWDSNVDETAELVEMVEATRQYQNNVELLGAAKTLMLDTLRLGQ